MESAILGFAIGVVCCQLQQTLGIPLCLYVLAPSMGVLALRLRAWWRMLALLILGVLLGYMQALWRAEIRLADRLSKDLEGEDIVLSGTVGDLPQAFDRGERFLFLPVQAPVAVPHKMLLTWYSAAKGSRGLAMPRAGETWRLCVRLRRPHASANPHGFDYEGWLFERGIGALGYVRPSTQLSRLAPGPSGFWGWIDQIRERIRDRFVRVLPDSPWRGVLVALVVGDQAAIPSSQWQLFSRTGVMHLVSISGVHVTMIGALVGGLVAFVWRRIAWLALRLPAQKAAVFAAAASAGFYVLLAGCGVPAQRTFYMLVVAALGLWLGRRAQVRRTLLLALLLVLLIDPWAVLAAGFWLSFIAVGALFMVGTLRDVKAKNEGGAKAWWREWWQSQWAVAVLTLPVLLGLFQQFSLISPLSNAVAIPAIGMLITPLALLFAVLDLPSLAELANLLLSWLMAFLQWTANLPIAVWQQAAPPWWLVVLASLGACWALLPRGVPARYAGLLCLLPLLAWQAPRPAPGYAVLTILDVGQGLAVHIRTAHHDVLYDTGPQYSPDLDAGQRIIVPYLRAEGAPRLDMMVVSHDDSDHAGGVASVVAGLPVLSARSSLSTNRLGLLAGVPHQACVRGDSWSWDGVSFEILHPPADWHSKGDNNSSCVLRVSTQGGSALLTGDIETEAEQSLLQELAASLPATIVIAPHHGSRSSSHMDFVSATQAKEVVFSNGYRNRFHHPNTEVVARYAAVGAHLHRSDQEGALRYLLSPAGYSGPQATRMLDRRYWDDR